MGDWAGVSEVDSAQTLRFFFERLQDEVPEEVPWKETAYVAAILAHYAQTPRYNPAFMSPSGSLHEILDNFVLPELTAEGSLGLQDSEILEVAGSHTLLLAGFFRDHMERRHNLRFLDDLGCSFFLRASDRLREKKRADLLRRVARNFSLWTVSCCNLSRTLREERLLLRLDS